MEWCFLIYTILFSNNLEAMSLKNFANPEIVPIFVSRIFNS